MSCGYEGSRPELACRVPVSTQRLLDVGCSSGDFGAALKKRAPIHVTGIEIDPQAAEQARKKLDLVFGCNLEQAVPEIAPASFDCVVFADVVEHVRDSERLICLGAQWVKKDGLIIFSIPNVRHLSVLGPLFFNDEWRYQSSGILDQTHVRFYTRKSFLRMLRECGLEVIEEDAILSFRGSRLLDRLTLGLLRGFLVAQYIFVARIKS
jgi:2-polyprenyl-3-methyl-5-hydroxy-6-metoxy-1,4-benzoquinol methylase